MPEPIYPSRVLPIKIAASGDVIPAIPTYDLQFDQLLRENTCLSGPGPSWVPADNAKKDCRDCVKIKVDKVHSKDIIERFESEIFSDPPIRERKLHILIAVEGVFCLTSASALTTLRCAKRRRTKNLRTKCIGQ